MTLSGVSLTRRKFMAVSSAAIATPFIFNLTGAASTAKAGEAAPTAEAGKKDVMYIISDDCIGCHYCFYECPESAIHWGDDKYVIDQDKCVQCGTCAEVCNISAAHAVSKSRGLGAGNIEKQ